MPTLETLDIAIAVVIVLLLLSLIVQSIQALLKKLLKIKSRQIEQSLVDLFQNIVAQPGNKQPSERLTKSPILDLLNPRAKHAAEEAGGDVKKLFDAVVVRFKEIGRVSAAGKAMLDSISKDDLLKVLRSVAPDTLLPELIPQLKQATDRIQALSSALQQIDIKQLSGEASAKFAAMHDALAPLLTDIQSIMSGKDLKSELLLGDIMSLRQIKLDDVLKLLGEVQNKVDEDIRVESAKPNSTRLPELQRASDGLKTIAQTIIEVRQKFDTALAPLRTKLTEVETWFDTVMQSFDERYTRSMKTWAIVISCFVVVFLNANFFKIYKNISTDDVTRNLIVQAGPEYLARAKPTPSPTGTPDTTSTQPSGAQTPEELIETVNKFREGVRKDVDVFQSFGFAPLKWGDFTGWLGSWSGVSSEDWVHYRLRDLKTLVGWAITAMLLSVGAPFWQDTLESLFGVKNFLRKRSDTKNVEDKGGQPKP
jgi:hypothetical protein